MKDAKELQDKDIENIPAFISSKLVLNIEEITPLNIFYSPPHKYIVKRERKRTNFDQS